MIRRLVVVAALWSLPATSAHAVPDRIIDVPRAVSTINSRDLEKLSTSRDLASLINAMPCPAQSMPAFVPSAPLPKIAVRGVGVEGNLTCLQPGDLRMIDVLKEHNRVRAAFGSQPLVWDPQLAAGASEWAMQLPRVGLNHSPRDSRPSDVRENLQHGLRGWSGLDLTRTWVGESRYFVPGTFPNVSSTGDWTAVAHYTQMVWPTTTRLGCASYVSGRDDWFVCRYSGPGNRDGTAIAPYTPVQIANGPPQQSTVQPSPTGSAPPPPPPTARDDAPGGNETAHPLARYFMDAYADHGRAYRAGDRNGQAEALNRMHYALQELVKRMKAARQAGRMSTVDAKKVKEVIDNLNTLYRGANEASRPPSATDQNYDRQERG